MIFQRLATLLLFSVSALLYGCSSALPKDKEELDSPMKSFAEAKAAYDRITPHQTDKNQLREIGFDPFTTPNISILNYLDIVRRFIPNSSITMADLDPSLVQCLNAKTDCMGIEAQLGTISTERYGNVVMDVFNFERNTKVTGWRFNALIILHGDTVVYKLWSGNPNVNKGYTSDRPLGPIQDSSGALKGAVETGVGL